MAAVGAWPVSWAPYICRVLVAGVLGPVWVPWGHGRSPMPRMGAVGAWPVPYAPYGCRGGVAGPRAPYGRRGGVARPLGRV